MQFSVSGREERRGLLTGLRQWLLLICQKGRAKDVGFPRIVGWIWADGTVSRTPVNCASHLGGSLLSVPFLALESVMSYTDVPQGGVLRFLMRNLMVLVVMLSNELVIVAPVVAFTYKPGSLL